MNFYSVLLISIIDMNFCQASSKSNFLTCFFCCFLIPFSGVSSKRTFPAHVLLPLVILLLVCSCHLNKDQKKISRVLSQNAKTASSLLPDMYFQLGVKGVFPCILNQKKYKKSLMTLYRNFGRKQRLSLSA